MDRVDMERVVFTNYAIEQFVICHKNINNPEKILKNPEKTARKILLKAKIDRGLSGGIKAKRIINNDFQDAMYFLNSGWRFVIKEVGDKLVVLTIERDFKCKR